MLPKISFESNPNTTATYSETIAFYHALADQFDCLKIHPFGSTDVGHPLHEVILSTDGVFDPQEAAEKEKLILFVNNAIHPGEPCGVDATMLWVRDLCQHKMPLSEEIVLVILPFYNVGGGLNRNRHSRANQVGPEAYGFRGNIRNYDLNRDFVKCDSKNAQSFNRLFNKWSPHLMIDNHTSNGADYQYTMTLISSQKDKLTPELGEVLTSSLLPFLYTVMEGKGWEMTPYVNAESTPEGGIYGFLDYARYSSGYAALHHTMAFMPETHMLKPYKDRVWSTYHFMQTVLEYATLYPREVIEAKQRSQEGYIGAEQVTLDWELDTKKVDSILFKGYTAAYKPSAVSGLPRLYYDRNQPYEDRVPFYDHYRPKRHVLCPKSYLLPQAYEEVADRLRWNGAEVRILEEDVLKEVTAYFIVGYEDVPGFEGHYLHKNISVKKETLEIQFYKGDYLIEVDQKAKRYIMETLEPQAPDGFFAWNFFDAILMQKEYFSPYVFEDLAAEILSKNPELRRQLDAEKKKDDAFRNNAYAQLEWVYRHSPYYEKTHRRFPIYRLER